MATWAVVVIHGVGETEPGLTVDSFLGALGVARPNLKLDGMVEFHSFQDVPIGQCKGMVQQHFSRRTSVEQLSALSGIPKRRSSPRYLGRPRDDPSGNDSLAAWLVVNRVFIEVYRRPGSRDHGQTGMQQPA